VLYLHNSLCTLFDLFDILKMSPTKILSPAELLDSYSTVVEAQKLFETLINDDTLPFSAEIRDCAQNITIHGRETWPTIPTPWKETEAITAFKALEAATAIALGKLRFSLNQTGTIDSDHATSFLFMNYLSSIDGYGKWDAKSVERLKGEFYMDTSSNPF
jgi:hypothetical protein